MHTLPDADEVATRAALLLSAPAGAVVHRGEVVGAAGLDAAQREALSTWVRTDPLAATPWEGGLRRWARAAWPGLPDSEVWILGAAIRPLPGGCYETLSAFLQELSEAA
jgi:hypothetical protein